MLIGAQQIKLTNPRVRIIEIDILRGIAVLGMTLWTFCTPTMGIYSAGTIDLVVGRVITFVDIENTTHLLFSFLFGLGLVVQTRLNEGGKAFGVIPLRRLLALFIIGIVTGVFLDRTDILHIFAMFGFILLLFVNLGTKVVLTLALLLIGASSLGKDILTRSMSYASYFGAGAYHSLTAFKITSSDYSDLVRMRAQELLQQYAHPHLYIQNLDILTMFLFGLYAVRRGLFQDIPANIGSIHKIMWFSLAAYLVGIGWVFALQHPYVSDSTGSDWLFAIYSPFSLNGRSEVVQMLVRPYTIQALSLFYICFIVLLLQSNILKRICLPLANVGRLALSNYLLLCFIGTTLFFGYGFGLYGKFGIAHGEGLAILVCGCQIVISSWWLRRFQFGPVEWLWRSITYWKPQPFRVPVV